MGRLTFAINATLDGSIDHRGVAPDDEVFRFWTRLMHSSAGMLWGRTVYELMENYWPAIARDPKATRLERDWARKLEAKDKFVVTSARREFSWNNTRRVEGDLSAAIKKLKKRAPRGLLLGSPTLAKNLHRLGLIDEYLIVVHPVVAGPGPRLFDGWDATRLTLVATKRFKSGATALRYRKP